MEYLKDPIPHRLSEGKGSLIQKILLIGASKSLNNFWDGGIDDFRIWSIALTDSEVSADMTTDVSGSKPDLIVVWNFEGVQGSTVPSLTGQHPGTLYGDAICIDPN